MHANDCIATVDVTDADHAKLLHIERHDQPTQLFVGLDLRADGSVHAGHWPDGEEWVTTIETTGVEPTA